MNNALLGEELDQWHHQHEDGVLHTGKTIENGTEPRIQHRHSALAGHDQQLGFRVSNPGPMTRIM